MRDPLGETLADGGQFVNDDRDLDAALTALVEARASDAKGAATPRRTRKIAPVIAIGAVLAVAGGGAVAATQREPWSYVAESDLVVAREWSDAAGNYLGLCESRLAASTLPDGARELAIDYLNSVDVDSIEPDPEWVAGLLHAVGRLAEVG